MKIVFLFFSCFVLCCTCAAEDDIPEAPTRLSDVAPISRSQSVGNPVITSMTVEQVLETRESYPRFQIPVSISESKISLRDIFSNRRIRTRTVDVTRSPKLLLFLRRFRDRERSVTRTLDRKSFGFFE